MSIEKPWLRLLRLMPGGRAEIKLCVEVITARKPISQAVSPVSMAKISPCG